MVNQEKLPCNISKPKKKDPCKKEPKPTKPMEKVHESICLPKEEKKEEVPPPQKCPEVKCPEVKPTVAEPKVCPYDRSYGHLCGHVCGSPCGSWVSSIHGALFF